MKIFIFTLIILAALFSPHFNVRAVRAQQAVSSATPTFPPNSSVSIGSTSTPTVALTLSATPAVTLTLSATPTETGSPTLTATEIVLGTATTGVTLVSSTTPEPTLTSTQTWPASATPAPLATQSPDSAISSTCPTSADGTSVCLLSVPAAASLLGHASLDSGLNPDIVSAILVDPSGQVIANAPLNPDGTFTLTTAAGNYVLHLSAPGYLAAQKPVTLFAGQPIDIAASLPAGDINSDNSIDALDLISLGAAYETNFHQTAAADLNGDGHVDLFDLTLLARNWRKTGPITW